MLLWKKIGGLSEWLFLFHLFLFCQSYGQDQKPAWASNPFEQKVFIENKGQFSDENGEEAKPILFHAYRDGIKMYFSANGLTYRHDEQVPMTEEEIAQFAKAHPDARKEESEEHGRVKSVPH